MIDRFKKLWPVSLFILCSAVAVGTWLLAQNVMVAPRDFEISRLEKALQDAQARPTSQAPSPVVIPETGVRAGNSVTSSDGHVIIHIASVLDDSAALSVTLGSETQSFKKVRVGQRLTVAGLSGTYYVDLLGTRGNMVDLTVSKGG
ncbi:hypothetical protein [Stenotrophomonas rhizophila]|uniref:Type II secretion system protein C (GspC) n=1 Tax=Stenotrophomonas rhizophila TaxID=216778 RepID=A0AAW5PJ18_9GAMM|nr:hypothetical protein [Stenotrophomonas rhizophila]MCS4280373.1 hypothetical protein [Stenotrophomonas rhizophila]